MWSLRPSWVPRRTTHICLSHSWSRTKESKTFFWKSGTIFGKRPESKNSPRFWQNVAFVARYTRIPVLVVSIYSLGYQQGIITSVRSPEQVQAGIFQSILAEQGVKHAAQEVHVVHERDITFANSILSDTHTRRHHKVAAVGHKIIQAARQYVQEQLTQAMEKVRDQLPEDITVEEANVYMERDEEVQFWFDAETRINGESLAHRPWQYVFVTTPFANAFVTEILPQRIFITTSMLEIAQTPNELAFILGHEVSHLILGHVGATNKAEMVLRTIEILFLSLDPTAGALTLLVIGGLAVMRAAVAASFSRENEQEADHLGIELAARANFDTHEGCEVLRKMNDLQVAAGVNVNSVRIMDTHPPSMDRYLRMKEMSKHVNAHKFHGKWDIIQGRFLSSFWGHTG